MNAAFTFTPDHPGNVATVVRPALRDTEHVSTAVEVTADAVKVTVHADTYARLQGTANSVMNLVKLADRFLTR